MLICKLVTDRQMDRQTDRDKNRHADKCNGRDTSTITFDCSKDFDKITRKKYIFDI